MRSFSVFVLGVVRVQRDSFGNRTFLLAQQRLWLKGGDSHYPKQTEEARQCEVWQSVHWLSYSVGHFTFCVLYVLSTVMVVSMDSN